MLDPHDYIEFRECERFLVMAGKEDALAACHDISDGGLLTSLVEACPTGVEVNIDKLIPDIYDEEEHNLLGAMFSEEGHRWIIAVKPEKLSWVRTAAFHFSVPLIPLGRTKLENLTVVKDGQELINAPMDALNACYRGGLEDVMRSNS